MWRWSILAAVAAVGLGGAVVLYHRDRLPAGLLPGCTFHNVTGLHCPGCGATRAGHALLHLRPLDALRYNAFLILAVPFLAFGLLRRAATYLAGRPWHAIFLPARWIWALLALIVTFTVLRNIPAAPFTLLAP